MSKTSVRVIAVTAVIVAAVIFLVVNKQHADSAKLPTKGASTQSAVPVKAVVVHPESIEHDVLAIGTVLANEEIDVMPEIAGRITAINFKEGTPVKKGQVLVKLNDQDLQALLQKLQFQEDLAKTEEQRAKKLLSQNLLSTQDYDAKLNAVQITQADIDGTKSDIAKTVIRAPFDGVIGLRNVSVGASIAPTTKIAHLEQVTPIKIEFSLPEKYTKVVKLGSSIAFTITGSDRVYSARVYAIDPKIDPATRTLTVRAQTQNEDRSLTPGAFAKVRLTLEKFDSALVVPTEAIIPTAGGQTVFIVQNGAALSKPVLTGIRTDSTIQVTQGLSPNDTVITSGVMLLHSGSAITVQ